MCDGLNDFMEVMVWMGAMVHMDMMNVMDVMESMDVPKISTVAPQKLSTQV